MIPNAQNPVLGPLIEPRGKPPSSPEEARAASRPNRRKLGDWLTQDQINVLTRRSDAWGTWAVLSTWGVIGGALALLAWAPTVWAWLVVVPVLAGRQLALAILQHEASHGTLFRTRWLNDWTGDWLCARPIWQNLRRYRQHHLRHHLHTGTAADPDIGLHRDFPVSPASMRRKLLRDAVGLTGLKTVYGLLMMDAGVLKWTVSNDLEWLPQDGRTRLDRVHMAVRNMSPMLLTNTLLWATLALSGHAWLYGAWVLAFLTPLPLFIRIRSMAEHGCLVRSPNVFLNTRTTRAGWLARATVAPMHVNFHLEHHAMASVPWQNLPLMHRWLREARAVDEAPGYRAVLKLASGGSPVSP